MKKLLGLFLILPAALVLGDTLVIPTKYETVDGTEAAALLPGLGTSSYQEVFDASNFLTIPTGGILITGFSWRLDNPPKGGDNFDLTLSSVQLSASTTSRNSTSLSPVFANNRGSDEILTRAAAPLHISGVRSPNGPAAFSITFPFQTPFKYDPSKGNLLLELEVINGAGPVPNVDFSNSAAAEGVGLVIAGNLPHDPYPYGPITQFTFQTIPEPSTWELSFLVAAVFLLRRHRHRWQDCSLGH